MHAELIVEFIKYYGPPMVANAFPVFIHGGTPIDKGKAWRDGKRILGDGKTWEGLATGLISSYLASLAISVFAGNIILFPILLTGSFIGLLGDIVESFFKRRIGIRRGEPLPFFDQLDFAIASTLFYISVGELPIPGKLWIIILSLLIILILHISTNTIAYCLGIKDRPW